MNKAPGKYLTSLIRLEAGESKCADINYLINFHCQAVENQTVEIPTSKNR